MSSLIVFKWPALPASLDQDSFRAWLQRSTNPRTPNSGLRDRRLHPCLVPLAVQAELGRGCNAMMLDALAAGPDHLPERLAVVSERILDCLDAAGTTDRGLVADLSRRLVTPIDSQDLFQLSRLFLRGIEQLAHVASTAASVSEPALHPIHLAVAECFAVAGEALVNLGDRDRAMAGVIKLKHEQQRAKTYCRQYFTKRLAAADTVKRAMAVSAARDSYGQLLSYLSKQASAIYRTALRNG